MKDLLESMLAGSSLSIVFQPIFEVLRDTPEVWGVEALTRGPSGTHFESASVFFDYVRLKRDELRVDRHCCENAINAAAQLEGPRVVTINAHASTLERDRAFPAFVLQSCRAAGLLPERLVIEIVEHVPYLDASGLRASLAELRAAGVRFAVDDLGFGHGNLRMFLDVRPEYVKVDRHFVHGCALDDDRRKMLRTIQSLARDFDALVIAEGLEQQADLDLIRQIGIPLAQGFLLGSPTQLQEELTWNARKSFV